MEDVTEVFRRTLAAFDRRDRTTWLALHDPDYQLIPSATWPEADVIHGPEAGWDFYVGVVEPFERRRYSDNVETERVAADKILVHQRNEVRGRASGADVELDYWVVTTFRDGRVLRDEWFSDRAEAVAAVGMAR